MMKKRYFYTALAFECAACIGAYLLQYFTARKMGMLRWVNHLCNRWSQSIDLDRLNLILILLVASLAVALLIWMLALAKKRRPLIPMAVIALTAVGAYLLYTICNNRRTMAAYYLVSFTLLLGAVIVLGIWIYGAFKINQSNS